MTTTELRAAARRETAEEADDDADEDDRRRARTGARAGARRALAEAAALLEEAEDARSTADAAVGRTEDAEAIIIEGWLG